MSLRALPSAFLAVVLSPVLSAQDPMITEFVASNSSGLSDQDGDRSDWIELHNPRSSDVDLAGWHLTDEKNLPTKWTFPKTVLVAGGHLLVFASNKDRRVSGKELHTNFSLAAQGEYLALYAPGGQRVAAEFAPKYPPQLTDVSYGSPSGNLEILKADVPCQATVPTSNSLGQLWTQLNWQPKNWLAGRTGAGYSRNFPYGSYNKLDLGSAMYGRNTSAYLRVPFQVTGARTLGLLELMIFHNDGFVAYLNGTEIARANAPAKPAWNSKATASRTWAQSFLIHRVNISHHLPKLREGSNVLAVHGLNDHVNSSEFLMLPQLSASIAYLNKWQYFSKPTPGMRNEQGGKGWVKTPTISGRRGYYNRSFPVTLSCATANATIRYTTDGSPPAAKTGKIYSGAITIASTTNLRAGAFLPDHIPSRTATTSFIFLAQIPKQPRNPPGFPSSWGTAAADYEMDPRVINDKAYSARVQPALTSLPAISLVMDPGDLFDRARGIYANPRSMGAAWERAASLEWIPAPGQQDPLTAFQADAAIRIQGGASRNQTLQKKHSFRFIFRGSQGAPKLKQPLFGPDAAPEFDGLVLRAGFNDGWAIHTRTKDHAWSAFLRDQMMRDMIEATGNPQAHGRWAHLYLNGLYWGLYNLCERPDAEFQRSYFGGERKDYDVLKHIGGHVVDGDRTVWDQAMRLARGGVTTKSAYDQFKKLVDVRSLADYYVINLWAGNFDWPRNNWFMARRRNPAGPFRFFSWDAERSIRDINSNRTNVADDNSTGILYAAARRNPEFQVLFGDRAHHALFNAGPLSSNRVRALTARIADRIQEAIICESARWGDAWTSQPLTLNGNFIPNRKKIEDTYASKRNNIFLGQIKAIGLYPKLAAAGFSQHGGAVSSGYKLTLTAAAGTIHYTIDGSDPRLEGGKLSTKAKAYTSPLTIITTTRVRARVKQGANWSALTDATFTVRRILLNELLAENQSGIRDGAGEREDWIELINVTAKPQDASMLWLSDDPLTPKKWQIPRGQTLSAGGTLLIWADEDAKQGPLHAGFKLAKSGEQVLLSDPSGLLLDRIDFGPQRSDVSIGRFEDGAGPIVSFLDPSPRTSNGPKACSARRFAGPSIMSHPSIMNLIGTSKIGTRATLQLDQATANGTAHLYVSFNSGSLQLPWGATILFGAPFAGPIILRTNGLGRAALPLVIPASSLLLGRRLYAQSFDISDWSQVKASSAVELNFCK